MSITSTINAIRERNQLPSAIDFNFDETIKKLSNRFIMPNEALYIAEYTTMQTASVNNSHYNLFGERSWSINNVFERINKEHRLNVVELSRLSFESFYAIPNNKYHTFFDTIIAMKIKGEQRIIRRRTFTFDISDNYKILSTGTILDDITYLGAVPFQWNIWGSYDPTPFAKYKYIKHDGRLLTNREIEILKWAAEGNSAEQIAQKLHLSIHTVYTHRKNILQKTGAKNIVEAIEICRKLGIRL